MGRRVDALYEEVKRRTSLLRPVFSRTLGIAKAGPTPIIRGGTPTTCESGEKRDQRHDTDSAVDEVKGRMS